LLGFLQFPTSFNGPGLPEGYRLLSVFPRLNFFLSDSRETHLFLGRCDWFGFRDGFHNLRGLLFGVVHVSQLSFILPLGLLRLLYWRFVFPFQFIQLSNRERRGAGDE
jgi:hypothetical protein